MPSCRERIALFGCRVAVPRLAVCSGDAGTRCRGGVRAEAPRPPAIRGLADEGMATAAWRFGCALANMRWRVAAETVAWHADEADLGAEPVIASVGGGAERLFRRPRRQGGRCSGRMPAHGSLLPMRGHSQRCCVRCLPPAGNPVGERVDSAFRLAGAS